MSTKEFAEKIAQMPQFDPEAVQLQKEQQNLRQRFLEQIQNQQKVKASSLLKNLAKPTGILGVALQPNLLSNDSTVSKISEREWRKLVGMYNTIEDFDPLSIVSKDRVKKSILTSIPDSLRGEIWCMLCHVNKEKSLHSDDIYYKLIDLENPD